MKIGTDGVLLGAWTDVWDGINRILDIGTGTGLVALMLAQRCNATIDAIEINDEAAKQAAENFAASPWADRMNVYYASLQAFETEHRYNLIVSNPPYFESAKGIETQGRAQARHTGSLGLDELVAKSAMLLTEPGTLAVIVPYEEEENLVAIARSHGLFPYKFCHVKGNAEAKIKRSLIQFTQPTTTPQYPTLVIENERHVYTDAYKELCKDFYLAF